MRGLVVCAICACCACRPAPSLAIAPPPPDAGVQDSFDDVLARIASRRLELATAYAHAPDDAARAKIRADARSYLASTIEGDLFPRWLGMRWGTGAASTATRPFEDGKAISCSAFVVAILDNAGFTIDDRAAFRRGKALDIQRSLARGSHAVRRYLSIPAEELARRIAGLGDGVWLIGLANHIGFVVVSGGEVRLVHASPPAVADEPLVSAHTIDLSRRAGYFVTPVIVGTDENDGLIDAWLKSTPVKFRS